MSESFLSAASTSRTQTQQLNRLAKLIGELAESRFERLESRVTKLERAS